uniref:Membrane protein UL56 n=1 Tax=Steinernema glaseri TaxID=37863 RepID=A0A1I7ZEU5_9BILA
MLGPPTRRRAPSSGNDENPTALQEGCTIPTTNILELLKHQPINVRFTIGIGHDGNISIYSVRRLLDQDDVEKHLVRGDYSVIDMSVRGESFEFLEKEEWIVEEKHVNTTLDLLYVRMRPTGNLTSDDTRNGTFCATVSPSELKIGTSSTTTTTVQPARRSKLTREYTRYPVRFATYKSHTRRSSDNEPHSYVDIINDKKALEEVRRSRTEEINATWTSTFLAFFGIEVLLMVSFVVFGLTMFVVLQFHPENENDDVPLA